jgi:hypothetical protein
MVSLRSFLPKPAAKPLPTGVSTLLDHGLECCRRGDWNEGLRYLGRITEAGHSTDLPGLFYSYLGYGIALVDRRIREGLKLCKHSIKVGFYEPENHVNLARTCLLANDRSGAVRAIRDGLKIDPQNAELRRMRKDLGVRSSPVLPFLDRANPLNVILGRFRHSLRKKS